jgi:acyl-[acyl-carrier-protein]-phospholipid O-acyltransferase/long-chain-fatty-acid--[acyl-carrier-protein] ligase
LKRDEKGLKSMKKQEAFLKRLAPLGISQFFGVFNDHAFKIIIVLTAISMSKGGYSSDSAFLALLTVIYVLPFMLFSEAAGYFSDRFLKRNVLIFAKLSELLIMLAGTFFLYMVPQWGVFPLLIIMFLMAAQSAFFSPAFNGILPEIFSEKELSRANGNIGMLTFIAVISGAGGSFIFKFLADAYGGGRLFLCGVLFSCFSLIGLLAALKVPYGRPASKKSAWHWNLFAKYLDGLKYITRKKPLFLAVLGEAFFVAVGTAIQVILVVFAKYHLGIPGDDSLALGLVQLAPAIGMGTGCYLAGRFSGNKVELGLVPFGAAGLVIFSLLTALFPGEALTFRGILFFPRLALFSGLLGVFAGLFVIPLRAYQQQKTTPSERGKFFANSNIICFGAIMVAGLLMFYLTSGSGEVLSDQGFLSRIQSYCVCIDPVKLMLLVALSTLIASVYIFWLLPEFAIRFVIIILTNTLYKLRIKGAENIPEDGPALLVANHVSFVDGLLITACSSRIVHFLMHEDFYRFPLLYPFVKWAGFIEVPRADNPKRLLKMFEEVKEALRRGEVVCVFPEGKLTTNGLMDEFKSGIARMIPEDIEVPLIPVRLGMIWGSIFSYYYGKISLRLPHEFPHPAAVTIGEPMPQTCTPFELRRKLSELAAETEMEARQKERPLHYQFAKTAKKHPFRKTVIDFEGTELSNFSLLVRSILLSREIRKLVPEDRKYVGVLLPNTCVTAATTLGVLIADKVPALLNYTASREVLENAVKKADLNCILTSRRFIKKANLPELPEMVFLEDLAAGITKTSKYLTILLSAILPHQELMNLVSPLTHKDVFNTAILLFSSGSTGNPKGVMLSHHNINSDIYSFVRIMGWTNKDSILGNLPLFHSFGITACFWLPLLTGCKVVYLPNPLDAAAVGKAIEKHKLSILLATPTFLQNYMRKCTAEQFKSLRLVVTGAEKLRHDIAEKFNKMTGLALVEGYGCTELSPVVSINISSSILDVGKKAGKLGSVGVPMPGICVKIIDPESGKEMDENQEGLMLVKGPNVMQGYLKEPEKTAEVLKDGWYNTGDIAKMDINGYLTITGRLSRFSKIAGEMVPHELVEGTINEIMESETRCVAVCGAPDKAKGEKLLVLYSCDELEPESIIEKLRERQFSNLWIPRKDNFHKVESLPLLGSGKLDLAGVAKIKEEIISSEN